MSNIKQIQVQNYVIFSVKLSRTLETSTTYSEQDYDKDRIRHWNKKQAKLLSIFY